MIATTDGRVQVLDRREDGVRVEEPAGELLLALLEVAEELGDVGADEEDVLAARDQDPAQALAGPEVLDRLLQLADRQRVELVDRVALQVEPQLDEAAVEGKDLHGLSFVAHGLLLAEEVRVARVSGHSSAGASGRRVIRMIHEGLGRIGRPGRSGRFGRDPPSGDEGRSHGRT